MKKLLLLGLFFSLTFISKQSFGQTCPANFALDAPHMWPTHSKWYFGDSQMMSFGGNGTSAPTVSSIAGGGFTAYESCASVSDETGNLLFYTNGVNLWDGTGAAIAVPGGRLLTGAENAAGDAGSAVQGVLIAKHPLDVENYYIFTTDDAIGGNTNGITNGFNYYVYNKVSNSITAGPTRLGGFRTTEQVNATWHNNGVDVWIVTHGSSAGGSDTYYSFLLECSGLNETPVTSNAGFNVTTNAAAGGNANERSSLEFANADPATRNITAAATHHCGQGRWDPANSVNILTFDNLNGTFTMTRQLSDGSVAQSNPYDCEFSADGSRLYVSFQGSPWDGPLSGRIGYFPVGGGAFVQLGSVDATGYTDIGALQLAGDGNIYAGGFARSPWGRINGLTVVPNSNSAATATVGGFATAASSTAYGLPNMFIPPRDWVQIQTPPALTECDMPYNLTTNWLCRGGSAENTPRYEDAYNLLSGPAGASVDGITGVVSGGAGTYRVEFEICTIKDTIEFTVGTCGCNAVVKSDTIKICQGVDVMLDSLIVASSGAGTWTIVSIPPPANGPPILGLVDNTTAAPDTMFLTESDTRWGLYKLQYKIDGQACVDTAYIFVNKIPTAAITPFGPLCTDSVAVNMVGSPLIGGDTTGVWLINQNLTPTGIFNPITDGNITVGNNEVAYAVDVNGCYDTATITVEVIQRAVIAIDSVVPVCADAPAFTYTSTNDIGTWGSTGTIALDGTFDPAANGAGSYRIWRVQSGRCGTSDTVGLTVKPVPVASIVPFGPLCTDSVVTALQGSPQNGVDTTATWSINGVVNAAGSFDPSTATVGSNTINYAVDVNGCTHDTSITVEVIQRVVIAIDSLAEMCANAGDVVFTSTANVGVWGGSAALDGTFSPSAAGAGTHPIYRVQSGQCGGGDTISVVVNPVHDATINTAADTMSFCVLDPNHTFTVNEGGGTWNNAAVSMVGTDVTIDLASLVAGNGGADADNLMLLYTHANPCGDEDTIWVSTTSVLDATITQVGPYCESNNTEIKLQAVDAGGTWSGTGITNTATGMFNPSVAGRGTHTIQYTIAGNCGDTKTIDIQVDAQPVATITGDATLCQRDNPVTLSADSTNGTWRQINGTGFNPATLEFDPSVGATVAANGYEIEHTVVTGTCSAIDTAFILVVDTPAFDLNPVNDLCADAAAVNLTITPVSADNGIWSGPGVIGKSFDPATAGVGTHTLTYTAGPTTPVACQTVKTIQVTVLPTADATMPGVNPMCDTDPALAITTSGNAGGTYSATCGACVDPNTGVFDPSAAGAGQHTITYTISGTCPDVGTTIVDVQAAPIVTIAPVTAICEGSQSTVTLSATPSGGTWSYNGASNNTGTFNLPSAVGTNQATYSVQSTAGCATNETVDITILPNPPVSITPRVVDSCVVFTETFEDNTDYSNVNLISSQWNFGNGLTSSALLTASTQYSVPGTYNVSLTNVYDNGCISTGTTEVYARPIPVADFTWFPQKASVLDPTVQFTDNSEGAVTYAWSFTEKGTPDTSDLMNPAVTFNSTEDDTVDVRLTVTNQYGCVHDTIKKVIIEDFFQFYIPNAFTPGEKPDGLNDYFYPVIRNADEEGYEFVVMDRWGLIVFQSNKLGEAWDGTIDGTWTGKSGKTGQIDVYVWKVNVKDKYNGKKHQYTGTVTVVR